MDRLLLVLQLQRDENGQKKKKERREENGKRLVLGKSKTGITRKKKQNQADKM